MDKTIVILLIGTLIVSLASGFIISFFVYQPQIQSLRRDIASLEDEIDSYFAENEESLSGLNETILNLNATVAQLNATSETPTNETETEYVEVHLAQVVGDGTNFGISFGITNYGTAPATLTALYLYQYPIHIIPDITSLILNGTSFPNKTFTLTLPVGASVGCSMTIMDGYEEGFNFQSGATLEFRFISAQGYNYRFVVELP